MADVLKMVGGSREVGKYLEKVTGRKAANWPVSRAMFEYLVNGEYAGDLPPGRYRVLLTMDLSGKSMTRTAEMEVR